MEMDMLPLGAQSEVPTVSLTARHQLFCPQSHCLGDEMATATYVERPQLSDDSILSMLAIFTDESMTESLEMQDDSALFFHPCDFLEGPQLSLNDVSSPVTSMEVSQSSDNSVVSMLAMFTEESMTDSLGTEEDSALFFPCDFLESPQPSLNDVSSPITSMEVSQSSDDSVLSMLAIFTEESMTDSLGTEEDSALFFHPSDFLESPQPSLSGVSSPATSMEVSKFSDNSILSMLAIFTEESMTDSLPMEDDTTSLFHASEFLEAPRFSLDDVSSPATSMKASRFSGNRISSMLDFFIEDSMVYDKEMEGGPLVAADASSCTKPIQLSAPDDKHDILSMLENFI